MLVKRRVDEELERRKDEIEAEVTRRVEAAKQQMEQEMMAELERRREKAREDERKREVGFAPDRMGYTLDTFTSIPTKPKTKYHQNTQYSSTIHRHMFCFYIPTRKSPKSISGRCGVWAVLPFCIHFRPKRHTFYHPVFPRDIFIGELLRKKFFFFS